MNMLRTMDYLKIILKHLPFQNIKINTRITLDNLSYSKDKFTYKESKNHLKDKLTLTE